MSIPPRAAVAGSGSPRSQRPASAPAGLLAIAAILAGGPGAIAEPAARNAQPVQVMAVAFAPSVKDWSYVGVVRPRYQSDLGFRVGGKIVQRMVDVGQTVQSGQPIARLDETDLRLALAAQQAELSAARVSSTETAATEDRYRALYSQGHVSKSALDQRISAAAEARSRVERAERNVALAANQLAYASLNADRDGVVVALPVETGQVVVAGQTIARVSRLDAIEVEVAIPEQMLEEVAAARAEVEVWGEPGRRLPARLREVAPEADSASRSYRARFAIETGSAQVALGRTATVSLTARNGNDAVRLPLSAVMNDGKGPLVWVVTADRGQVVRTPVQVLGYGKDEVLVGSGVRSGDLVVTLGVHMLDPGKPVRIVEQRTALQ